VRGGDLHRTRSLLGVGIFIRDDWNFPPDQWQHDLFADEIAIALVLGVHRHTGVAEHRFRPRRRHDDESFRVVFQWIAEVEHVPARVLVEHLVQGLEIERNGFTRLLVLLAVRPLERSRRFDLHDFQVRDRCLEFWIPVDESLVLVDQARLIKLDKNFENRAR